MDDLPKDSVILNSLLNNSVRIAYMKDNEVINNFDELIEKVEDLTILDTPKGMIDKSIEILKEKGLHEKILSMQVLAIIVEMPHEDQNNSQKIMRILQEQEKFELLAFCQKNMEDQDSDISGESDHFE